MLFGIGELVLSPEDLGAVERDTIWEPREEDVLGKSVMSNLMELKEGENKLDFLFGGSWERILVVCWLGLRRDCLSSWKTDRSASGFCLALCRGET